MNLLNYLMIKLKESLHLFDEMTKLSHCWKRHVELDHYIVVKIMILLILISEIKVC